MLRMWYLHASARAPNPSWVDMDKVTGYYAALYRREDLTPPGGPVMTHVMSFMIKDDVPTEADVEAAVRCLCQNKAGVHMQLRSDNLKKWPREAYLEEGTNTPPNP